MNVAALSARARPASRMTLDLVARSATVDLVAEHRAKDGSRRPRIILRWTGVAAIVISIGLVILELSLKSLREWWVARPLILGVAAGLLTLLIGALVVERLVAGAEQRLQELQYRRVQAIALRALGASVTQVIDGMNWLVLGKAPSTYATGVFGEAPTELAHILARRHVEQHEHDDPDALSGEARRSRALDLIALPEWQRVAIDVLDVLKWRHRSEIAEWASLMMASAELSVVLDRLAYFNEIVGHAQTPLRELHHGGGDVERAEALWFAALADGLCLREDLYVAAGDDPATWSKFRAQLPEQTRERFAAHDEIASARQRLRARLHHPELAGAERPVLTLG